MTGILFLDRLLPREGLLWLLSALGLLLAGWFKGINLLMLLAFLMLALWVVNGIAAFRQIRGLRGQRKPRGPFFAGDTSLWDVELTNPRKAMSSGWRVFDLGPDHEQSWFVEQLKGGQSVRCAARTVFPRRGIYRAEPLVALCRHPFGLVQQNRQLCDEEQWVILPALGQLDLERFRNWIARLARSEGQVIRTSRPSMIRQDDLHGLRPFRPGDSPRWIHWRTSARRNQKMVREFEEASGQNLILIVDPWGPAGEAATLDRAVSLAATICWEWSRHGHDQLFFATATAGPVVISGSSTREKSLLMLRQLAVINGETAPDATPMLQAVSRKVVPEAPVIVVSARRNSPLAARLSTSWNRRVIALHVDDAGPFYQPPTANHRRPTGGEQ
jgi:uncharacterized protein (DUF58 family)